MNVTPNTAEQIKLINNDQINAWLHLSHCSTLIVACFLHRAAVATLGSGEPVSHNTPLALHNRGYRDPG